MPGPIKGLFRAFDHLLVAGMVIMSLMVFWNVVLRYVFNSGIPFSVEVSRLIFVWIIFLGSIIALSQGLHMSVDTLVSRLPRRSRLACLVVSHALMLWCCWLLWQGSWIQTQLNWGNRSPISGVPVGAMYASGLFAAFFMALILLGNLWRATRGVYPSTWSGNAPHRDVTPSATEVRK